jgi:hypothetical protein
MALASPSINASAASVALLRAPLGLPFGLPLLPFGNLPAFDGCGCFGPVFSAWSSTKTFPKIDLSQISLPKK